ncbi:hypothetical protein JCM10212_003464 [Sporobolomyces blumeae]
MRSLVALVALVRLTAALPAADQLPFSFKPSAPLAADADFETYSHPSLPSHQVRLREPQGLCDPGVKQWAGYLDVRSEQTAPHGDLTGETRHLFTYIFESRNDPKNDPVVLWLNGGPGCSSFTGLLQENGPCKIQEKGDPVRNPHSWNSNATVIFLDQPVGVGFSYSDKGDKGTWTTEAAARDTYAFLQIFFDAFADKFGNSEFHMAGESYGGRYVPLFADYIVRENEKLKAQSNGLKHINLASILVGNGFTDPKTQYASYIPTVCGNTTGYGPYLDEKTCDKMRETLPRCQELSQKCYDNPSNSALCLASYQYCENTQTGAYYKSGRNPYDMTKFGDYAEEEWIERWLNKESVRRELGVDREAQGVKKFVGCSDRVMFRFTTSGDQGRPSYPAVAHLVNNGVAALFYSGRKDFICNWTGNEAWTTALEWTGSEFFRAEPLRPWYASKDLAAKDRAKDKAGEYRQYGNLAFAVVEDSGHFVPYDHPAEALAMLNEWTQHRRVGHYAKA